MSETRVFKFITRVGHSLEMTNHPTWAWPGSRDPF